MKNFKQWQNEKKYFELNLNPNAAPIKTSVPSSIQRGATSPVVSTTPSPAPAQNTNTTPNTNQDEVAENDPTYLAMVQGLSGNLGAFTTKLIKALKGKNPQIVMSVQAAINNAVNDLLGEKGASFANRANRATIVGARQNLQN
jgi:hypothetical protein